MVVGKKFGIERYATNKQNKIKKKSKTIRTQEIRKKTTKVDAGSMVECSLNSIAKRIIDNNIL